MTEKEFNLSEKIMEWNEEEWEYMKDIKSFNKGGSTEFPGFKPVIPIKDIKEFIKRLKEIDFSAQIIKKEYPVMKMVFNENITNQINKLAGDKLK